MMHPVIFNLNQPNRILILPYL